MDCSTTDMSANVVRDSPGKNSSSSDDDVPLSKLLTRQDSEDKQSLENTCSLTFSSNTNSKKDKGVLASDNSSDDEPLIKMKTAPAKKSEKKENTSPRSNGTNKKSSDLKTDDSSETEPLTTIDKVASKAAKKPFSVPSKKSVDTKKKEALDDDASSDDEPLTEVAKKVKSQRQGKSPRKANLDMKSKRNAARQKVKYAESSSDSSAYEPLATKRKKTKAAKDQKSSAKSKKTKPKLTGKSLKDNSSDEDDVPLVNLIAKQRKPVKKNTKTTKETTVLQGNTSKKRQGPSDESSDDEPLIHLVKKTRTDKQSNTKTRASTPKKRAAPAKQPKKKTSAGLSSNSSDEPLIKAARHPQVTKILRIILERCDVEEAGATASLNKTRTERQIAEEPTREESEGSEESPEEEE